MECPESQLDKVKKIIESFVDKAEDYGLTKDGATGYNWGWHIPEGCINWTFYIFYGADIRIQQTDFIKDQVIEIATTVFEKDGEYIEFVRGIFDVEDEEKEIFFTWKMVDGNFIEIKENR